MAREEFETFEKGDRLSASWVNTVSRVCGRFARIVGAGSTNIMSHGDTLFITTPPPFVQQLYEITAALNDNFEIKPRWYNRDDTKWETDTDHSGFELDGNATGALSGSFWAGDLTGASLEIGMMISAYFDPQLDVFIPINRSAFWRFIMISASGALRNVTKLKMDGTNTGQVVQARDPLNIFSELGVSDVGIMLEQNSFYYLFQAPCP